jgi:hypothetical protein
MPNSNAVADAQRDDPSIQPAELIAAYEKGTDELRAAVSGMTVEQLLARPISGMWSTLEVVCHIADTEQFFADRLKRTAAMDRPLLMGADGFHYPAALDYQRHDLAEELALVAVTRRQPHYAYGGEAAARFLFFAHEVDAALVRPGMWWVDR